MSNLTGKILVWKNGKVEEKPVTDKPLTVADIAEFPMFTLRAKTKGHNFMAAQWPSPISESGAWISADWRVDYQALNNLDRIRPTLKSKFLEGVPTVGEMTHFLGYGMYMPNTQTIIAILVDTDHKVVATVAFPNNGGQVNNTPEWRE